MRWMHLSDIHVNKELNNTMSTILREELPKYIKENKISVDYLFLTGDYRDSAYLKEKDLSEDMGLAAKNVAEYIIKIADALQVSKENIFLVPGNHDLSRGKDDKKIIDQAEGKYFPYKDGYMFKEQEYLLSRFDFFDMVNQKVHDNEVSCKDSVHTFYELEDFDLLCLNTAISSYGNHGDGELIIDSPALYEAVQDECIEENIKPVFVLGHYKQSYFVKQDQENFNKMLNGRKVFYLCGHAHKISYSYDDEAKTWEIMMGAIKNADQVTPTFAVGEINRFGLMSSLDFYKYDFITKGNGWMHYQRVISENYVDKICFVGRNFFEIPQKDSQIVKLSMKNSVDAAIDERGNALSALAEVKYKTFALSKPHTCTVSFIGLPLSAGIVSGYALHKRQNITLYYEGNNFIYKNASDRQLNFKEEEQDDIKDSTLTSADLCVYIQAKNQDNGISSFHEVIENRNPDIKMQNIYSMIFINQEEQDASINLEKSAAYLSEKIAICYDKLRRKGVNKVNVHLFYNGSMGLAVLLGNQMATTFPLKLYDYDMSSQAYKPSFRLEANMFII